MRREGREEEPPEQKRQNEFAAVREAVDDDILPEGLSEGLMLCLFEGGGRRGAECLMVFLQGDSETWRLACCVASQTTLAFFMSLSSALKTSTRRGFVAVGLISGLEPLKHRMQKSWRGGGGGSSSGSEMRALGSCICYLASSKRFCLRLLPCCLAAPEGLLVGEGMGVGAHLHAPGGGCPRSRRACAAAFSADLSFRSLRSQARIGVQTSTDRRLCCPCRSTTNQGDGSPRTYIVGVKHGGVNDAVTGWSRRHQQT